MPTVCYGPGDLGSAHAPDEHVDAAEVLTATRTYALLIADWCGGPTFVSMRRGSLAFELAEIHNLPSALRVVVGGGVEADGVRRKGTASPFCDLS